jgi:hypothetical protein
VRLPADLRNLLLVSFQSFPRLCLESSIDAHMSLIVAQCDGFCWLLGCLGHSSREARA